MGPIQVVVEDGNNLVLEVTPTPDTTVILDRGIAGPTGPTGPVGPQGPGDVNGPASATDNAVARFDGTTGKLIENSVVTVSDTGAVAGVTTLAASGAVTLSGLTASTALALDASKNVVSVTNTGTGNNVLSNSPTLVTPALGTPASGVVTNLTGTASININGTVGATTANTGAFTTLSATGNVTLGDATAETVTINGTVQPGVVISGSSTGDALRITQTGTGNALVVEDATNPDATPFVIDSSGNVVKGNAAALTTPGFSTTTALTPGIQSQGTSNSGSAVAAFSWQANASGAPQYILSKSRGASVGTFGVVSSGDSLGGLTFNGDDGTAFVRAATIVAQVDGTPGTNDMPGRLVLSTTPDGSDTPVERVRITSAGKTGFATDAPAATVHVAGNTILSNVNVIGASYDSVSFSVAGEELTPTDLFFSPDGLKMYVIGSTGDDVNEYNLSTAWVVSSAVFATNFSVSGQDTSPTGLFFRADGTKMYVLGATNDAVYQYTLSTPWSVATASYDNISFSVTAQEISPSAISFKPNGLSMYVVGNTGDAVYQYTLSTAWNVSTATFLQSFSVSGQESVPTGMAFTGDGSRMFIVGSTGDDVNVYNLTTPWDISTSAFVNVFSVSGQDTSPQGIYIKPDGTKMYIMGQTNDTVYQYTVPSIDIQLTGPTSAAALDVQQDLTVYGNTTGSFLNNGFRENISGQYYNLVSQTDIGTAPNEIPLNQYLGNLAYQDAANIAGPVGVGGALTVVGATTLAATTMASATVTGAVEAGGGVIAEQLLVDNFTAASSAVLRGGSTNLLTYSEQFDNAAWTKTRSSITANAVVAPDGTLTGDKLVEDTTASNTHNTNQSASYTSGTSYSFSVFVKASERTSLSLQFPSGQFGASVTGSFNLLTGTATLAISGTSSSVSINPVGNGWYRCSLVSQATSTGSGSVLVTLENTPNNRVYTGDGTSGIFIWGAQLNTGAVPAAYLQTVATAITTAYAAPIESPNGLAFPLLATMTPARNADMTFELASNTSLVVKVRGSDGTVRSATLLLV